MRRLKRIRLIQRHAVHIHDAAFKVDRDRFALGGDHALYDRLAVEALLAQHDNVAALRRIEKIGDENAVAGVQRVEHGGADNADHADKKRENQNTGKQRHHERLDPVKRLAAAFFQFSLFDLRPGFIHKEHTSGIVITGIILHNAIVSNREKGRLDEASFFYAAGLQLMRPLTFAALPTRSRR